MSHKRALDLARRYANGGSVSEDDVYFGGSPIDRLKTELKNRPRVPEKQAAENRKASGRAVLENLPVIGNVMAAGDAMEMGQAAIDDFKRGDYAGAFKKKVASKAFGLASMLGLPVGKTAANVVKGASSRAGVFVPATDDAAADMARDLRAKGARNETVQRKTGLLFSPEGRLLEEIPDRGAMKVNSALIQPGAKMQLGDLVEHDELFQQFPHLRKIPVEFTSAGVDGQPLRGGLTKSDGTFLLSSNIQDQRGDLAKLLQYQIGRENNMAPAVRHTVADVIGSLEGSVRRVTQGQYRQPSDVDTVNAYIEKLGEARKSFDAKVDQKRMANATEDFARRSAGNVLAKRVQARVNMPEHQVHTTNYPYGGEGGKYFDSLVPLVPENVSPSQVRQMLLDWRQFGAGRPPKFADGGRVHRKAAARGRRKLAVGAIAGVTPGRSDELPVKLPAGAYVIPADIVSALGEGNTAAGFKKLDARFPGGKRRLAKKDGGGVAVDAIVSDGEYVVSPDKVAELGSGDVDRGHAILDLFVKAARQAHIKRLQGIPDPNK